MPWDGQISISCNVTNTGSSRAVEEVVQLYVHDAVASRVRPVRELKGFQKIHLEPGQTETVVFYLSREQLQFATAAHSTSGRAYTVEPGKFFVWVAPSAAAGMPVEFHLADPLRLI